jgi:hypothetical protein
MIKTSRNYHRLEPPIKTNEAMFVIHLMHHKWDKDAPYPGFKSIAQRMGLSTEAARLHARSLESKGYLFREMQIGQTNRFHLDRLFVALKKLMSKDDLEASQRTTATSCSGWKTCRVWQSTQHCGCLLQTRLPHRPRPHRSPLRHLSAWAEGLTPGRWHSHQLYHQRERDLRRANDHCEDLRGRPQPSNWRISKFPMSML